MAYNGLVLGENGEPRFNQPVPLRLVPLITDWTVNMLLGLMGDGYEVSDRQIFPLDAFIYDGTPTPKSTHRSTYNKLRKSVTQSGDEQAWVSALPANHFVWSDDLVNAFTRVIDDTSSREEAVSTDTRLIWAPDTNSIQPLLDECPDFEKVLPDTLRNMTKTQLRYQEWCKQRQELIDSGKKKYRKGDGNINESAIAETIKGKTVLTVRHICKMIRKHCK